MVKTIRVINRELSSMNKGIVDATDMVAYCGEAMVVLTSGTLIAHEFTYTITNLKVEGKDVGELARAAGSLAASIGEEIVVLCECSAVVGEIQRIRMYERCLGHVADVTKNAKDELVKPRSDGECFDGENVAMM